jgi:hypothetical protein
LLGKPPQEGVYPAENGIELSYEIGLASRSHRETAGGESDVAVAAPFQEAVTHKLINAAVNA